MQRYFGKKQDGRSFLLSKEDSYHILTVMRMTIGDTIEVVWEAKLYLCQIVAIDSRQVIVEIIEELKQNGELPCEVTIAQALVKENKMDYLLQKAVELGVSSIIPFASVRSIIKVSGKEDRKVERWQRIVKEASEQSKRLVIPRVSPVLDIDKLCKVECELKLLCTVNELSNTIKRELQNYQNGDRIIIVVGPEGGFTKEEENKLLKAGYRPVSLGNLVLRTETVGLYVMSIINYYFMR